VPIRLQSIGSEASETPLRRLLARSTLIASSKGKNTGKDSVIVLDPVPLQPPQRA
jgi:hypothetical protein